MEARSHGKSAWSSGNKLVMLLALRCVVMLVAVGCLAQQRELSELTIEDLMDITVTSANRKAQRLDETAAAVYIITQDEIRRSGLTSLPEVLRLAPGVSVAQVDANTWAITARGFNGRFANRLLVLIDGRSVYMPTYSGVYWDVQDVMLEDVERIEVIRGPGATMWGANAVNGVINIITKKAADTQGALISTGLSLTEQRSAAMRYGGTLGKNGYFRMYGKYFVRDGLVYADGSGAPDGWDQARGGFRGDYSLSTRDSITFQGDMYGGTAGQHTLLFGLNPLVTSLDEQVSTQGGNFLGRWTRASSERSEFSLQAYVDSTRRNELLIGQRVNTLDLEFQHHRALGKRHDLVWGLSYRRNDSRLRNSMWMEILPEQESENLFSGFVQDEISLLKRRLHVTMGSKFEHNDYTGFEVQPNLRLLFAITSRQHVWAAVSRATRTPSQSERTVQSDLWSGPLPNGSLGLIEIFGSRALLSEKLLAYEAGYRWQLASRVSFDVAGFYNVFDDATSVQLGLPFFEPIPVPSHLLIPVHIANNNTQRSFGTEVAVNVNVARWWKVSLADTWQQVNQGPGIASAAAGNLFRPFSLETPHQQVNVGSTFLLPRGLEFNVASYYVGRLVELRVPSYTRLDVRLGWRPSRDLELSVGGQNLLQDQHAEYGPVLGLVSSEVRRNAYMRATWHF